MAHAAPPPAPPQKAAGSSKGSAGKSHDRGAQIETLRALLEPVVARTGCELTALELVASGKRTTLRLYVDRAGGVGVDHCAAVSQAVGPVLDVADPLPTAYDLEVSSPGIDRLVQRPEDFRRFAGFRAKVRLAAVSERRNLGGVLRGLEDGDVLLESQGVVNRIPLVDIERVRLDLTLEEFEQLGPPAIADEDPTPSAGAL